MLFIQILFVTTFLMSCASTLEQKSTSTRGQKLSILQGLTWSNGAILTVLRHQNQKITYSHQVGADHPISSSLLIPRTTAVEGSNWVIDRLVVGLTHERSFLEVKSQLGQLIDRREIAARDLKKSHFKIALISCMDHEFKDDQAHMWKQLAGEKPDYIFMLGDNVYATRLLVQSPSDDFKMQLWNSYVEARHSFDFYYLDQLVPTLAQWDDHDYGMKDGNKTLPHRQGSQEVFDAFFAQNYTGGIYTEGPQNSGKMEGYGGSFYFLDGRSEREPSGTDSGSYAHLGKEQYQWLFKELEQSKKPAWLMMGDQFFGGYHKWESYEGNHPKSFSKFLKDLRKITSPVIFASGDRHLSELMQISPPDLNYTTYEITSSPMHAKTYASNWDKMPNKRQVVGKDFNINYVLVEGQNLPKGFELKVTAKTKNQKILFSRNLKVKK